MPVRRFELRDEPILDPELPIVDAHHHLILNPVRYMVEDFLQDANAGHNVIASVLVEMRLFERQTGPEALRPLGEVEFANGVGAMTATGAFGKCHVAAGIVGFADMRLGAGIAPLLDRCMDAAADRFRGVRQIVMEFDPNKEFPTVIGKRPPEGIVESDKFLPGLRELGKRGLTFDVAVFHYQLPRICEVVDAVPEVIFVLNHLGIASGFRLPEAERLQVFAEWRHNLRALAQRPNVVCKIGGLGLPHWGFDFASHDGPVGHEALAQAWAPYVETGIETFGADRCMMESNYPPDGRSCGYVPLWNALKYITAGCSAADKAALFHGTANRIYRLDIQGL